MPSCAPPPQTRLGPSPGTHATMKKTLITAAALIALLAVSSCASPTDNSPEASLCKFPDKRPKTQLIVHVLPSGLIASGEIDTELFRKFGTTVLSAMARPDQDHIRKTYPADCHDKARDYWYPCTKTVDIDLSKFRGIGRAATYKKAERIAVRLCESLTRNAVPKVSGLEVEDSRTYCRVSVRKACPLPTNKFIKE